MDNVVEKIEEVNKVFAQFKKANDERLAEIEKKGHETADRTEKVEKLNAELDRVTNELKALQTAMQRQNAGGGNGNSNDMDEKALKYKQAFNAFARKGHEAELKTMSVDVDTEGGFLVTPQMSTEIVKKVFESSPLRLLSSVQTISTDSYDILQDLDEVGSGWVGEQAARPATASPTWKKVSIFAHELYANVPATQKILDDAAINVESYLAGKGSEKFGRDEATAFVSGNGVNKPQGILSYTSGTSFNQIEQVVSGHATQVTADGLLDLQGSLKEFYQQNASFLMKRTTVTAIRKLKDSQNQYLWAPGLQPGQPDILLGKPLYHAEDMEAVGASALAIAYGDFRAGYQIVDRVGIRILRDPYSSKPNVLFYMTKRVGGGVKNFEAIKLQKIST